MAQGVAEAAVDVWRHVGGDARHDLFADSDCCLGNPGKASLDRVEHHRAGGEIIEGETIDITADPLGVFDDVLQPKPLTLSKQVPGPGRSQPASAPSAQVRRPDRWARAAACAGVRRLRRI